MKPFDRRLDPDAQAQLDALDAALRDDAGAEPALLTLVDDVRSARPTLEPAARERLEARAQDAMAARQPHARRAGSQVSRRRPRWQTAVAVLAVAIVAMPVAALVFRDQATEVLAGIFGTDEAVSLSANLSGDARAAQRDSLDAAEDDSSAVIERQSRSATAGSAATAGRPASGSDRRVVRDAQQTLRVARDEVATAAGRVTEIVAEQDGYVASSSVREAGSRPGGRFTIVVPSAKLNATIAALASVGRQVSLERSTTDVTDQAVSLDDRLRDLRADRSAVRLQLAQATEAAQRAAKRRELRLLSSRVARLESERRTLRRATSNAGLSLRLTTAGGSSAAAGDDDHWGLADAWRSAGHVLQAVGGALLIALAVLAPFAILVILVILVIGRVRARRRQRTIADA